MIIKAAGTAPPHMFLRGFRAPAGGAVYLPGDPADATDDRVTFEEVGAFVARSQQNFDGTEATAEEVATEDLPYADMPDGGPFRYEADIPVWKPAPDVIVVDDIDAVLAPAQLATFPPPYDENDSANIDALLVATPFGTAEIDRGTGFGAPEPRNFGWLPRGTGARLTLAGNAATNDPWALNKFDGAMYKLPAGYDNAFQNGGALVGQVAFATGDRLRFTDTTGPAVVTIATIPAAPTLSVTRDGAPLDPPLTLMPLVDTVVMDRGTRQILFVWRATFPWEERFETATLEVS